MGKTLPVAKPSAPPRVDPAVRERELAREAAVAAVNGSLGLLETLAQGGPQSAAALAEATGRGRNATQEWLSIMATHSFVVHDEAQNLWRVGARWSVLSEAAAEQGALTATAMPFLTALGQATGENVYLRVRDGMEAQTIAVYQTDPNLRIYTEVGARLPLHAGTSRLLLAHAPEAVQTQVLARRLQRYTPSTRTDPAWVAGDLHRTRQRGYLITDSEVVAGTVTVCAPVYDASRQVIAALLIAAPSLRMRPPRPRTLLPIVLDAAIKLSAALGAKAETLPTTHTVSLLSAPRPQMRPAAPGWPGGVPARPTPVPPPRTADPASRASVAAKPAARPNPVPAPVVPAAANGGGAASASGPAIALAASAARPHSIFR